MNENQKSPRYAFDCTQCHKSLKLVEKIYFEHYHGHELCMSCRPVETDEGAESNE